MIASGKSEGTCPQVPFKKDLMIRRLSLQEVGILFIHSVQGTSRSFPTYRGIPNGISKLVTLYLACLCTIGVFATNSIWSISMDTILFHSPSICYVCASQGTFSTVVLQTGPPTLCAVLKYFFKFAVCFARVFSARDFAMFFGIGIGRPIDNFVKLIWA